ncbi:hypothetical protein [Pedobacter nyackensis]|uniref:hypothetical protein n=1 Tax=Pedobacter nyackensis TaxID=475255 RepID=UPI00292EC954|nr:hypothetical protein [Pedobacter nyackensis]
MKISSELIEKYHRNECNQEEIEVVETWLFSGDSDEALQLPLGENKAEHKVKIWNEIEKILPIETPAPVLTKKPFFKNPFWSGAIAASVVFCVAIIAIDRLNESNSAKHEPFVMVNNTSAIKIRNFEANGYNIAIGTNTSTKIDHETGIVDLSGSLLIRPKKDIELLFEGSKEKMKFKAGQTYIILKGETGNDKVIIVNERNIMDLPPVIQKQIINEFQI